MIVDRMGLSPSTTKLEAVQNFQPANTVEQLRALVGASGFLRRFVPHFSTVVAPLTDLLRRPEFSSKRARKQPVPWGPAQDEALSQLIHCLTSSPILALPVWKDPFLLHTDASEIGSGAALTQVQQGIERALSFASHRWSVTDAKRSPTEREAAAILWAVEHFRHYLWGRRFKFVTDCSALIWLFNTQNLSPKLHRWTLRLIEYSMDLEWREGRKHHLPDALSRLPRFDQPVRDIDVSFPGESPTALSYRGPQGPVLDGIPLSDMGVDEIDYQDENAVNSAQKRLLFWPRLLIPKSWTANFEIPSSFVRKTAFTNWDILIFVIRASLFPTPFRALLLSCQHGFRPGGTACRSRSLLRGGRKHHSRRRDSRCTGRNG